MHKKTAFLLLLASLSTFVQADDLTTLNYSIAVSPSAGTFNFALNNTSTNSVSVNTLNFDYAGSSADINLPTWGFWQNFTVSSVQIDKANNPGSPMYQYTLQCNAGADCSLAAGQNATVGQIKLGNAGGAGDQPIADYQGLFSNLTVNGSSVNMQGACAGTACQDPFQGKLLGAYFADWSQYAGHGKYNVSQIPFNNLNTIYYAIGKINATTGNVMFIDPWADVGLGAIPNLAVQRQKQPYLNLLMSYGGWGSVVNNNYPSGVLSELFVCHPDKIATVAQNMVNTMLEEGFNGVDVDYEWSGPFVPNASCAVPTNGQLTQAEADGYADLMYDLHQDLSNLDPQPEGFSPYTLTTAVFSGVDKLTGLNNFKNDAHSNMSDLQIIAQSSDKIALMSYDYHSGLADAGAGSPNNVSANQAQFSKDTASPLTGDYAQYNVQDSVKSLETLTGIAPNKVMIGVPAYSRIEAINAGNETNKGLYQPLLSIEQQAVGAYSGEFQGDYATQSPQGGGSNGVGSGTYDYKCMLAYPNDAASPDCYYSGNAPVYGFPAPSAMPSNLINVPGTVTTADGVITGITSPWMYSSMAYLSYDDSVSAGAKAEWAKQQGLGGVMMWEIDGDVSPSSADYQSKSLLYAMYQALTAQK